MKYSIETKQGKEYDVVVCGGGAAGVAAAIAAARQGASTMIIERTFTVGGMLTLGEAGITKFTEHCKDIEKYKSEVLDVLKIDPKSVQVVGGIPHEYCMRMLNSGGAIGTNGECGSYIFTDRYVSQITLMDMLKEVGVDVLYDSRVCLVNMDGDDIKSVVVVNKEGFTEYSAKCFVDCTGDADVAALSGVEYHVGASEDDVAENPSDSVGNLHSVGTMYRVRGVDFEKLFAYFDANPDRYEPQHFGIMSLENVKKSYRNGEAAIFNLLMDHPKNINQRISLQVYNLPAKDEAILLGWRCGARVNGLKAWELSAGQEACIRGPLELMASVKKYPGFENAYVCYIPDVGVRETRHIVGKYKLSTMDMLLGRDFEDSIACGGHPIDVYPIPPEIQKMDMNHWRFHIPYRIMLPQKVRKLLVAGRSVSASRLAFGAIRPTAQCMAMGEAAGIAAAMSAHKNISPDEIDVKELRDTLVRNGAIV